MPTTSVFAGAAGVAVLTDTGGDSAPLRVRGVALTADDNTHGSSKKRLFWPEEVVKQAVASLAGTKIVDDREHVIPDGAAVEDLPTEPPVQTIVGEVTDARYEPGLGAVFEGEIDDPKIASLVENGRVEVSPFIFHERGAYDDSLGAFPVRSVAKWRDLAVVANGAGSKASIEPLESTELTDPAENMADLTPQSKPAAMSVAVLSAALDASFGRDMAGDDGDEPGERSVDYGGDQAPELGHESTTAAEALASFNHLSYSGTATGDLDESAIDSDDFATHYLFPGETKSDSSFPVVDASGTLRRGNVSSAWDLRGHAPVSGEEIERILVTLASKFDDPPQTEADAEALSGDGSVEVAGDAGEGSGGSDGDNSTESGVDESAESDADSNTPTTTMSIELTDEEEKSVNRLRALDDPVVVESETQDLAERADAAGLSEYDDPHIVEGADYNDPHVAEADEYESLTDRVGAVENVLAEALAKRTGMKTKTAAALSIEDLFSEFEDEEGEFSAEALVQEPEVGDNGGGSDTPSATDPNQLSDEEELAAEALAESVMTVADWRNVDAEELSAREYVEDQYGADPATATSEKQLRRKIASGGGD